MYSHQILVMIRRWNSPILYAVIKHRIIVAAKLLLFFFSSWSHRSADGNM